MGVGGGRRWQEKAHKQGSREEREGETELRQRNKNHILKNANGLHQSSFFTK